MAAKGSGKQMKTGAIIHVERGYQIIEVLEQFGPEAELRCVGFRLVGPRTNEAYVYTTEQQAKEALAELSRPETRT